MLWEGIKYAKTHGFKFLDFGLSDLDQEGLLRYKRQFATEEKRIYFLRHRPSEVQTIQEQQIRRLLPALTNLFTDEQMPDNLTEQAGEVLYRFFA